MKMNNARRFAAVLMALLLSVTMVLPAFASSVIITEAEYDAYAQAVVEDLYARLLACEVYEEVREAAYGMTRAQFEVFLYRLIESGVVTDDLAYYDEHINTLFADYLIRSIIPITHSYTNVAPFLAPVTGSTTYNLRLTTDARSTTTEGATSGLVLDKTVSEPDKNGQYTITLKAHSTGSTVTTETETFAPADIVLVLDLSTSMDEYMKEYTALEGVPTQSDETYYVKVDDTYVEVTWCNKCGGWTNGCETNGPNATHGTKYTEGFYSATNTVTRLSALGTAVNAFVDTVVAKAQGDETTSDDNVSHRISVIAYNSDAEMYVDGEGSEEYASGLVDVSTAAGEASVLASVTAALAKGGSGTYTHLGIAEANAVLAANPLAANETRTRVVIVFTDGSPANKANEFNTDFANTAISNANTTKNTYGATVYTIGIVNGADGSVPMADNASDINKFLHYVSSNFKAATSMTEAGTATYPAEGSYYLSTDTADGLKDIFTAIASNIETTGGTSTTLTEESVVTDIISPYFALPDGAAAADIIITTAAYQDPGTFGSDDATTEADNFSITIGKDGKTISVSGFDFSEEWCGTETAANGTITYRGRQLILQIPIVVPDGFLGGNNVPTNDLAGIYENASAEEPIQEFPEPDVDVPLKTIIPTINDDAIYLSNYADLQALLGLYEYEQSDYKHYEYCIADSDGNPVKDANDNVIYYPVDGVNNAYVDIVYTFKDSTGNVVATFTIAAGEITGSLTYDDTDGAPALTEDTTYTVECTITASSANSEGEIASTTGSAEGTVYVYKPVLTFNDTTIDYGDAVPNTTTGYTGNLASTAWMHGTTAADQATMGTPPAITLTHTPDANKIKDGKFIATDYVAVDVAAAIGDADITSYVTFLHQACDASVNCQWDTVINGASLDGSPAFLLHVATGELILTKTVVDPSFTSGSFTFTLTGAEGITLPTTIPVTEGSATVTSSGNTATIVLTVPAEKASVKLAGIPGGTYTVAETAVDNYTTTVQVDSGEATNALTAEITITAATATSVAYTNTRELGNLTITKKVEGKHAPARDYFTINLSLKDGENALAGEYTYTATITDSTVTTGTITSGTAELTVQNGTSVTITGLPAGAEYVTLETVDDDYTTTVSQNNSAYAEEAEGGTAGVIDTDGEQVNYLNTYKTGSLAITKSGLENKDSAIFKVEVSKTVDGYSETFYVTMGNGTTTLAELPYNAAYTVTEQGDWTWRYSVTSITGETGTIPFSDTAKVTVVNKKDTDQWLSDESSAVNNYKNLITGGDQ